MATPSKRWPTNAEWARIDGLVGFRKIRRLAHELSRHSDDPAFLHSLHEIGDLAADGELKLRSVGPQVPSPEEA